MKWLILGILAFVVVGGVLYTYATYTAARIMAGIKESLKGFAIRW